MPRDLIRRIKNLFGLWEPREGIIYRSKYKRGRKPDEVVQVEVMCSLDGKNWSNCTFKLEKGVYEIHLKTEYGKTVKVIRVEKKYVSVKKKKSRKRTYWEQPSGARRYGPMCTCIRYRLLVKDRSKIVEVY